VVVVQLTHRELVPAVLTGEPVTLADVDLAELDTRLRGPDGPTKDGHGGNLDGQGLRIGPDHLAQGSSQIRKNLEGLPSNDSQDLVVLGQDFDLAAEHTSHSILPPDDFVCPVVVREDQRLREHGTPIVSAFSWHSYK